MRTINTHKLSALNQNIKITVLADPDQANSLHDYYITGIDPVTKDVVFQTDIHFQKGPVKEAGLNGISDDTLLAVVIDRLQGFQKGPFSCRENAVALTHIETALLWLQKRTMDRITRGVEGESKP